MLPVLVVGFLFKETVVVTAVLFLFTDLPRWERLKFVLAALLWALLLKVAIAVAVEGHFAVVPKQASGYFTASPVLVNLAEVFLASWNHVIFVNGGTLFLVLVLPRKSKAETGDRVLLWAFFGCTFFGGSLAEFRILLEVLPVSVMFLRRYWPTSQDQLGPVAASTADQSPAQSVLRFDI
jgi:hypothetical protein